MEINRTLAAPSSSNGSDAPSDFSTLTRKLTRGNSHMTDDQVRLEVDAGVATITTDNPEKRNAYSDAMDQTLFGILGELKGRTDVRAVIWRGEGHSFSSGRDVSAIGVPQGELTHHQLMTRGQRGILQIFDLDVPILVAMQGWSIGGSFQRALLCDIRVAADDARFMLPELGHGVIPDTGGVARLFQICGPGVVSDLVLTGRPMDAAEALAHGIVSRIVARDALDATVRDMAERIAAAPTMSVKLARRVISHLADADIRSSMADELMMQTLINGSHDYAEFRSARAEERDPTYTGS
jgi:enoyl-CoA hydratase/carnithine racemase